MKFLYLEKRQRLAKEEKPSTRTVRIVEELEAKSYDYEVAYLDQLRFDFENRAADTESSESFQMNVIVNGQDISSYTHIIFGGHSHESTLEYEMKLYIVNYIDRINETRTEDQKIHVQNSNFIKKFPYYTKLGIAVLCSQTGIPHLNTSYFSDGRYPELVNSYPTITKHYIGLNDLVEIDGELKPKKTVFKVDNSDGWQQERLAEKDLKQYIIQEFSDAGEDFRIFISKGKVIGGWRRKAGDTFMTVTKGSEYLFYNDPAPEIREICEKAAKAWDVDFMALDFMYQRGKPYVVEFSMHPGFKAYETKIEDGEAVNIAKAIIESFEE